MHAERIHARIPEPLKPREVFRRYYLQLYREAGRALHLAANLRVLRERLLLVGGDPRREHDVRYTVQLLGERQGLDEAPGVLEADGAPVLEGELDAAELAPPLVFPEIARLEEDRKSV